MDGIFSGGARTRAAWHGRAARHGLSRETGQPHSQFSLGARYRYRRRIGDSLVLAEEEEENRKKKR